MKALCIYHADCYDGFAAAWVVHRYYRGEVEFHRGIYATRPPEATGRHVIVTDFCYTRAGMEQLRDQAATLNVYDHHNSNKDLLDELSFCAPQVYVVFDKARSGAGITWDVLFEGRGRPPLLDRIEDRDTDPFWMGNPRYDDSRLIHAALESYPMDFDVWTELMRRPLSELRAEGERLEAKHWNEIRMLLPITQRNMRINGVIVPVANVPITLCSDAGTQMAQEAPFAATYMDTVLGRQFSLRSVEDGADVSKIAAKYGKLFGTSGGGHPHAAGFLAPRGWEGDASLNEPSVTRGEHAEKSSVVEVA
jgi:uncharacterized protein